MIEDQTELEMPSPYSSNKKLNKPDIDLSDLVIGYNMLFSSNYKGALEFFGQYKDEDIRYLMGYTQTILLREQVQCLPPNDSISQALQIVCLRTFELTGIKQQFCEMEENILEKIPFETNHLFYWAMTQFIKLQYLKYLQQFEGPEVKSIMKLLKKAKIDPLEYAYEEILEPIFQVDNSYIKDLFKIEEKNTKIEIDKEPRDQECELTGTEQQEVAEQQEGPILGNISSSKEIQNMINRFIVLKIISKDNNKENQQYFDPFQKMVPNFDLAWMLNGDYLIYQQKHQEARQYYDRAFTINNFNSVAVNNKGYSYEYDNHFNETDVFSDRFVRAIEFYQQAIDICPHYWIYYNNVAVCRQQLLEHSQAVDYLLKSLEINPNYINGLNRFIESFAHVQYDENFMSFLRRSTVVLKRDFYSFLRVFEVCKNINLLPFFNVLNDSLIDNFSITASFILSNCFELRDENQIFFLLEENLRFILCDLAYQKNLKEYFMYQPSIFLWDLFIE